VTTKLSDSTISELHDAIQLAFLTKAKVRHFGVLSALVKDSRQFKRENRFLKVVTVNLPLYKQLEY
jgi:hypothetical protein